MSARNCTDNVWQMCNRASAADRTASALCVVISFTGSVPTCCTGAGHQSQMNTAMTVAASAPAAIRSVPKSCDVTKKTITNRLTWAARCRNQYLTEGKRQMQVYCAFKLSGTGVRSEETSMQRNSRARLSETTRIALREEGAQEREHRTNNVCYSRERVWPWVWFRRRKTLF